MRLNAIPGLAVIAAFVGALTACGEHGATSPISPSLLSSTVSEGAPRSAARFTPRRVDEDGDGYEDPTPGPPPEPGTGEPPNPEQGPPPDGVPAPVQLTINVVGLLGNLSFAPNPLQAVIGNTIVWMNSDVLPHDIVLDDGTPVGNLAPGQSSLPIVLAVETMSYHCTIHPSMVGQIAPIPTTDPSQSPTPDPSAPPANPDPHGDGDGYGDDGYDDDYYY